MHNLKIYLAGKMSGLTMEQMNTWRNELEFRLSVYAEMSKCKIKILNPVKYYNFEVVKHQTEREVKDFDLRLVNSSDIVVVNLDGLQTSDGTKYELHDARKANIPVLAFGDCELYEKLHPWTQDNITRVDKTMDDIAMYIKDFYMT